LVAVWLGKRGFEGGSWTPPKVDQAKRLKELEQENSKLKRLVAELGLDKQILQDIARGNF
jgi:cell division protein FtsB